MDDNIFKYHRNTSQFLNDAKLTFYRLGQKQKDLIEVIRNMSSRSQTKLETQRKIAEEFKDYSSELSNLAKATIDYSKKQDSLARGEDTNGKEG